MKQVLLVQLLITSYMLSNALSSQVKSNNAMTGNTIKPNSTSPVWEGWVKYYHYESGSKFVQPEEFFINSRYFTQKVLKTELSKRDSKGLFLHVPSKFYFYARLFPESLSIQEDRESHVSGTTDVLNLKLANPGKTQPFHLAIGEFPEGFCFNVEAGSLVAYKRDFDPNKDLAKSTVENWIICQEKKQDYEKLMNLISSYVGRIDKIRRESYPKEEEALKPEEATNPIERYEGPGANQKIDGFLVLLNDWTGCTLKCGGGWSYQQWKCVPPKKGGRECSKQLVRKKPCNEQPCPGISHDIDKLLDKPAQTPAESIELNKEPMIRSMYISQRYQQDQDCVIKESDVLLKIYDKENKQVLWPSRLIMNKDTISLFTDTKRNEMTFSFKIRQTSIAPSKENCCLIIKSEVDSHTVCGMSDCSTFAKSWTRAHSLFKTKCFTPRSKGHEVFRNETDLLDKSQGINMGLDVETAREREELLKKKLTEQKKLRNANEIQQTEEVAMDALDREINLEEMIKREEMLKSQNRIKTMISQMKKEEEKKRKLEEVMMERAEMQSTIKEKKEVARTISQIKRDTQKQVQERRKLLKEKIQKIRDREKRRSKLIQSRINLIRTKMAEKFVEANKNGDSAKCLNGAKDKKLIQAYCEENMADDITKLKSCLEESSFCIFCCDNEFGAMNVQGKDDCYNDCGKVMDLGGEWSNRLQIAK